jgi:hypothetical protein
MASPAAREARPEELADHGVVVAVREFSEGDLPEVVELFQRVFPQHGWNGVEDCTRYFRDVFFDNPWRDAAVPSWVAMADGRVAGFAGMMSRPMLFRGKRIRVAVDCNFFVDPALRRSLAAVHLGKAILSGPQDLTLADGASDGVRQLWCQLGGEMPLGYNLHWMRSLRPARHLLHAVQRGMHVPRAVTGLFAPGAALADALAARLPANALHAAAPGCIEEPADAATIAADLPQLVGQKALHPCYEAASLAWLLRQATGRKGFGTLRARRVLDSRHRPLGTFVYYLQRNGVSEVLQLAAPDEHYDLVLQRLFADAWREGAVALRGRVDPDRAQQLSRRYCWLRWEAPATLVHSRDPEVLAAIRQGDSYLSRLDGEWWMRFVSG